MNTTEFRLRWGILGTGIIAHTFAGALKASNTGQLIAVGSRRQVSAEAFAKEFPSTRPYGCYEDLLSDPAVQAVYISAPHPFHAEWCIKAARAGKHILCEKPLTLNHNEAMLVAEAARENGVFLMEAFMYRCLPKTTMLLDLIRNGTIGDVGSIQATLSFTRPFDAQSRLFKNALGGGSILDLGCYAMSAARLVAGAALGRPFVNPTRVTGFAHLHPETQTDLYAVASVEFPDGILAQLASGIGLEQEVGLHVYGSAGSLHTEIWDTTRIVLKRKGAEPETVHTDGSVSPYTLEADAVGDAITAGHTESACMSIADSLGNMAALDAWRSSAGLVYESERHPGLTPQT